MAQQTTVILTDDIDGGKAVETVSFGLDGKHYVIDLGAKNAKNLRKVVAAYIEAGRKVTDQQWNARRRQEDRPACRRRPGRHPRLGARERHRCRCARPDRGIGQRAVLGCKRQLTGTITSSLHRVIVVAEHRDDFLV